MLHCLCFSFRCRFCSEMQGFTAMSKTLSNQRPKAATYLCRSAAKARFDNRPNPRRVFPKREGRSPPSLVAQGWGIFKGEGRSKLPSPLNGVLWILSFAKERKYPAGGIPRRGAELPCLSGKKVTRRRHKGRKRQRAGQSPAPTLHLPKASTFLTATAPQIPRRGAVSPPAPPAAARSSPPRPRCRTPRTWPPAPPAAAAPPGPPRFSAQARCVPRR